MGGAYKTQLPIDPESILLRLFVPASQCSGDMRNDVPLEAYYYGEQVG